MRRLMPWLVLAGICAVPVVVAARFGSYVAGGSDSYCYVHQAERWASGRLLVPEALALEAPWPDAPLTFAPAGHVPSPTVRGAIVPICPPGVSMLMAPALLAGGRAAMFAVIPLCGVLLVIATWLLGRRIGDGVAVAAAAVTATSPIVLYQVIQPMSDVPAAAFWVLALALATRTAGPASVAAGVCAAVAILIRPNLVPLGFVIGLYMLLRPGALWGQRLREGVRYAMVCAAGCLAVAAVQQHFYGSPLASGYGATSSLFSLARIGPNASRYLSWLMQTHGAVLILAAVAPFVLARPFAAVCAAFCLVNIALYLPYLTFDDWSYVRFLLPAVPVVAVLAMGALDRVAARGGARAPAVALSLAALVFAALGLREARARQVFQLAELESVYARAGRAVGTRLPRNALIVTSRFSGSVRFYGSRPTLVWDVLDPSWLDRAIGFVREKGFEPYLLLDSAEESAFRTRFAPSDWSRLDWPPQLEIAPQVRVYRPASRERYLAGETIATEYVR